MLSVQFNQCIVFSKMCWSFCLCSVVCLYKAIVSVCVCACVWMCGCACMCLFSVWLKQTPDKALIITEEQGYGDDKVLVLFWTFLIKEMPSSIHPYMIGVGLKSVTYWLQQFIGLQNALRQHWPASQSKHASLSLQTAKTEMNGNEFWPLNCEDEVFSLP